MSDKKIYYRLLDGRLFSVLLSEVAEDRAKYYAAKDPDTTYQAEHDFVMSDDYEGIDWLQNNMNWWKCFTLREETVQPTPLSDAEVTHCGWDQE